MSCHCRLLMERNQWEMMWGHYICPPILTPTRGITMFPTKVKRLLQFRNTLWGCASLKAHCSRLVLGIETSCDDTGAAVMDETGKILGESLHSQKEVHLRWVSHLHSGNRLTALGLFSNPLRLYCMGSDKINKCKQNVEIFVLRYVLLLCTGKLFTFIPLH